jgi:hypothetical protein
VRLALAALLVTACGGSDPAATTDAPGGGDDAALDGGPGDTGFGELSGMCGVLMASDLTGAVPELVRDTITFERAYVDPDDRALLTEGGQHLAETPNAGGSSGLSEIFAYEQLARCEQAMLLETETEIVYGTQGKITDMEVSIDGEKIGVSVTRAFAYPLGSTYTLDAAETLIMKKLQDIQVSSANVSADDAWTKQILSILAYDTASADTMAQAWMNTDAGTKADTIVVLTTTGGDDTFIYTNM